MSWTLVAKHCILMVLFGVTFRVGVRDKLGRCEE